MPKLAALQSNRATFAIGTRYPLASQVIQRMEASAQAQDIVGQVVPGVPYGEFVEAESLDKDRLHQYIKTKVVPNIGDGRSKRTPSEHAYNIAFNRLRNILIEKEQSTPAPPPMLLWPNSVSIRQQQWTLVQKDGFFVYESPEVVKTTQKFGKNKLRSHVRVEGLPLNRNQWDGSYHVTYYVRCDDSWYGVEPGDSLCFHTNFRRKEQQAIPDGPREMPHRSRVQNDILTIAQDFWNQTGI